MLRSSASRLSLRISAKPAVRAFTTARIPPFIAAQRSVPPSKSQSRRLYRASAARSSALPKTCPSCSSPLPTPLPVCPRCSYIARLPPSATYYDVLDIPYGNNAFDVDATLLKNNFRDLQRVVHPDKWSGKGPAAQESAAEMSGMANRAYGTLMNPYTRAEYILQLEGLPIGESDNVEDSSLIMEIMEMREELDIAETPQQVEHIRRDNLSKIDELLPTLSSAVATKDWAAVKKATIRLKYLQSIDSAAQAWPNQPFDH